MREKKIKIRSEIDDRDQKNNRKKLMKLSLFLEKVNKIDQSLTRLTKRKERRLT